MIFFPSNIGLDYNKKRSPCKCLDKTITYRGFFFDCILSLFLLPASFHLGAGNITLLIQEIKVAYFSFDTAFRYLLGATSLFRASGHLSARDITLFVNIIEITFRPLYSYFHYFVCHFLIHPPSFYKLCIQHIYLSSNFDRLQNLL